MKILVLSLNAWNLSNSTGNTISNLFSGLDNDDEVANIYCRNESIDNKICGKYFRVTEKDIVNNLVTPMKCGNEVVYNRADQENEKSYDHKAGQFLRQHRFVLFLLLRELIWDIPVWKNAKLKKFVTDFKPDIIYMHGHCNLYMHRLLSYCQQISGAKVVMYWGDDMYGRKSKLPLGYLYESMLRRRFEKSIQLSSLLFGGSLQLCEEYSQLFNKQFVPFFKECKCIKFEEKKCISNTLTIVYAGNLLFGREKIMVEFVKSIGNVNKRDPLCRFVLKIYSNTTPSAESLLYLDDRKNSYFLGCKPYLQVCEEMDKSELVLFIESFDKNSILSTRLSFSTKIIDCIQSTAGILAIGPKNIASMDYLSRNGLGYTITSVDEIEPKMAYLSKHSEIINELNMRKVDFATKYHTNTSTNALREIKRLL